MASLDLPAPETCAPTASPDAPAPAAPWQPVELRPLPPADAPGSEQTPDAEADRAPIPLAAQRIGTPGQMLRGGAPSTDYVLPGLPLGKVGILAGSGGQGKSWLVLEWLLGLTLGWRWPWPEDLTGWRPDPASVAYLTAEEDRDDIWRRLGAIGAHLGSEVADDVVARVDQHLDIYPLVGQHLTVSEFGTFTSGPLAAQIRSDFQPGKYRLIVVDPLSSFAPTCEEGTPGAVALRETTTGLAQDLRTAILLVHHVSQTSILSRETGQTAVRGPTGLVDGTRWVATLTSAISPEDAVRDGMEDDERKRWLRLTIPKLSYAPGASDITYRRADGGVIVPRELPSPARPPALDGRCRS